MLGCLRNRESRYDPEDDLIAVFCWIRTDDEVGSLLLESVHEDQQLYNWPEAQLRQTSSEFDDGPKTLEAGQPAMP
jgi:hypothetical protein